MKIGISVQGMIGNRVDGGRRYAIELLKHLVPRINKNGHQSVIFCSNGDEEILNGFSLGSPVMPVAGPSNLPFIFRGLRWGLRHMKLWQTKNLAWYAKKSRVDFIHFFGFMDYSYTGPCAVTLHCLQHEYFPEFFENAIKRSNAYKKMLKKADVIITNSKFTAKSINGCFRSEFDNKIIMPVLLGGGEPLNITDNERQKILEKYNLYKPYLIYPASSLKHKNHKRLLDAFSILIHEESLNISLVLTGFDHYPELEDDIVRLSLEKCIRILGKIPDDDLLLLLKGSICMSFVSLFEGFGLPVVEAMSVGTPVVCSNVGALPEIGGDAVLYVNPFSAQDIAEKLMMVIRDDSLKMRLSETGKEQSKQFSWTKCAKETLEVYEKIYLSLKNCN